jgi:hypothetical protein
MNSSYNNFANYFDADFFFGRSALQNYLSEILSIIVTIFVVDQIIRYRHRRINRPLRNIGYVRLFDELDDFIEYFVPVDFYEISTIRNLQFGNYSTFVVRTLQNFKLSDLKCRISEEEDSYQRSVAESKNAGEQEYGNAVRRLNERAQKLIAFENRIQVVIEHYSMHFTNSEVQVLNEICLQINQHFSSFSNSATSDADANEMKLSNVIPYVADKVILLWQQLLRTGMKNQSKTL